MLRETAPDAEPPRPALILSTLRPPLLGPFLLPSIIQVNLEARGASRPAGAARQLALRFSQSPQASWTGKSSLLRSYRSSDSCSD